MWVGDFPRGMFGLGVAGWNCLMRGELERLDVSRSHSGVFGVAGWNSSRRVWLKGACEADCRSETLACSVFGTGMELVAESRGLVRLYVGR
jgi:hypothetical protein